MKENHYKASCKPLNRAVRHPRKVMKENHYKASCKPLNRAVSHPRKVMKVYTVLSIYRRLQYLERTQTHTHTQVEGYPPANVWVS